MTDPHKYRLVKSITEGEYREKGSRFLAFCIPCLTVDEAKNQLDVLRKNHPGAVHVCYAWRLGKKNPEERSSDDGEPSGSAGKPILGQLHASDVVNCLIAVVRYYGGINLGVGGLMQAYKASAKDALEKAIIEELEFTVQYEASFSFDLTGEVMRVLQRRRAEIRSQSHNEHGTAILFEIPESISPFLQKDFEPLHQVNLKQIGNHS